jgi:hypothetical protein
MVKSPLVEGLDTINPPNRTDHGEVSLPAPPTCISYERGGVPVELLDESDWRRAIVGRQLKRSTTVRLYRGEDRPRMTAAGAIDELLPIFDEIDPQPPEPPPSRLVSFTIWR